MSGGNHTKILAGLSPGAGGRRRLRDVTALTSTTWLGNPGPVILPAHDPAAASHPARAAGQAPALITASP